MDEKLIEKTKEFVKQAFIENPHYSFNHWSVMYDHSVKVSEIALKLSEHIDCDKLIVALAGLLHDIGKTHQASPDVLYKKHEKFNVKVAETFLDELGIPQNKLQKLKKIIDYESDSIEMKVMKDSDILAFYQDKKLYMLYIKWAINENLKEAIDKKLARFSNLNFEISKKTGKKWFEQMKRDWKSFDNSI